MILKQDPEKLEPSQVFLNSGDSNWLFNEQLIFYPEDFYV